MQQSLVSHTLSNSSDSLDSFVFLLLPQNVLHDVPHYEERRRLLETLKNRLEALLSPKLTAAFNNHLTGVVMSM